MRIPNIDTDDLVLFGSLALAALGAALLAWTSTDDALLALGVLLIVFGLPAVLLTFMAAAVEETK